jgi:hypothetical protein
MPPHCCSTLRQSIFAEWGLVKANTRRVGCSEYKQIGRRVFAGHDESRPSLGRDRMKEATKRAASEALAQTLAVTAMLVIAGVLFYSR